MTKIDKSLLRDITYGMYIVSSLDENNKKVGCVINTLTQLTSSDPIVSICLNKENYTNKAIQKTRIFSISILSEETPKDVISTFGYNTSKDFDKFSNIEIEVVNNISIVKEKSCGYLLLEVINIIDCNTHDIVISKVISATKENLLPPMTYKYYHEKLKGTSPKNAPTFIEETNTGIESKYRCKKCGYIYDNAKEKIKFEDLPDDWICPLCKERKDQFEKIN